MFEPLSRFITPFTKANVFSQRKHNHTAVRLNALQNISIKRGGKVDGVFYGDTNTIIQLAAQEAAETATGSASQRFRVKGVAGDYLTCVKLDTDGNETGGSIYVAKQPELRRSLESEKINGVTVDYTYSTLTNNSDGKRVASAAGYSDQTEIVIPVWRRNEFSDGYSEILASEPVGGTGVSVDGVAVTWMEDAGRGWCQI